MRSLRWIALTSALISAVVLAPSSKAAPDDACVLLTQAQVSEAVGAQVSAGRYTTPTFKKTCTWVVPAGSEIITLMLQSAEMYQSGKSLPPSPSVSVIPVSGVGDDAYYIAVGTNAGLIVKKGDVAFKVSVYSHEPLQKKEATEKKLALEVIAKL